MRVLIDLDHLPKVSDKIKIKVSRRGMMAAAVDAAEAKHRIDQGSAAFAIEDLAGYDDDRLDPIHPVVNSRAKISLKQDIVYAETYASADPIPLFDIHSEALFIFNQFNGQQPIAKILVNVAEHTGWDEQRTRETVRAVFLKLCEVRVCEPGQL